MHTFRCNVKANHNGTFVLTPAENGPTNRDIIPNCLSYVKLGIISINSSLAKNVDMECNRDEDVVAKGDDISFFFY